MNLDKTGASEAHRYVDKFIDPVTFEWQSQNRTSRDSEHGRSLKEHRARGLAVHLFIRKTKKIGNRSAPFVYCGDVDFISWERDKPITVRWKLPQTLPASLLKEFMEK